MFFAPSKSRQRAKTQNMVVSKVNDHIKIKIKMPNPSQEPPAHTESLNQDIQDMDVLCTFKIKIETQTWIMDVSKTNSNIKIQIEMPNPSQEPPVSSKASNQDLKGVDRKCTTWKMKELKMHDMKKKENYLHWKMTEKHTWKMKEWKMHEIEND